MTRPKRIEIAPAAVAEGRAARRWYRDQEASLGDRFRDELADALRRIGEASSSFAPHVHGTRRCLLRRFPYLVVFRELDDVAQVIAIAHAKRRPGYWRSR